MGRVVRSHYPDVEALGANPLQLREAADPMYTVTRHGILDRTVETILPADASGRRARQDRPSPQRPDGVRGPRRGRGGKPTPGAMPGSLTSWPAVTWGWCRRPRSRPSRRSVIKRSKQGETAYVNALWTARNRSIGTKHIFVGPTRAASKLSPREAHVDPTEHDQLALMLGRWFEVRSETANETAQNICKNPHYQAYSQYLEHCNSQPDSNFVYFFHPDLPSARTPTPHSR